MANPIKRDDVPPGTSVKVIEKHNQKTGVLTEGIVKQVLTASQTHPYGIKVLLENGAIGRVKDIIETNFIEVNPGYTNNLEIRLPKNEDQKTEFKATFKFHSSRFQNTGEKDVSREVEKSISKTIAAFMNAEGGTLYIGIDDYGKIIGLTQDYSIMKIPNSDKFRLTIKNSFDSFLKNKIVFEHTRIEFPLIDGTEICKIVVTSSSIPVFVHDQGKQECYVRVDNESKLYNYDEFLEYWQRHLSQLNR